MNKTKVQFNGLTHQTMLSMQETYAKDALLWKLLVKPFREHPDGDRRYWKGEFWGKYMRGCALICAYTQDDGLYAVLEETVRDMLSTQDELGRFSSYAVEKEFDGWDIWCRKYVMLGMQFFMEICRDGLLKAQIVEALKNTLIISSSAWAMKTGKFPCTKPVRHGVRRTPRLFCSR